MNLDQFIIQAIATEYPTGISTCGTTPDGIYIDWVDDSTTYITIETVGTILNDWDTYHAHRHHAHE